MVKPISSYTGQDVFLANQAGLSKSRPRKKAPNNQATLDQVVTLYQAGHRTVLADWVRHEYPDPETQAEVQDILEIALEDSNFDLESALAYIQTYVLAHTN